MGKIWSPGQKIAKFGYQCTNYASLLRAIKAQMGANVAHICGAVTMLGELHAVLIRADGTRIELGLLGKRVVTDAGVEHMVDDWDDGSGNISNFNFHDSGTSATAENQTDTNLIAEAGPTTRATGTKSQPAANQIRSVGTIAYTSTLAIVEHGLFSTAARTTDLLWDRTVFSAINVENLDSIQYTYTLTITAGG